MKQFTEKEKERIKKAVVDSGIAYEDKNVVLKGNDVWLNFGKEEFYLVGDSDVSRLIKKIYVVSEDSYRLTGRAKELAAKQVTYYQHEIYGTFELNYNFTVQELRIGAVLNTGFRIVTAKTGTGGYEYMGMLYERITKQWLCPFFTETSHKALLGAIKGGYMNEYEITRFKHLDYYILDHFDLDMPELRAVKQPVSSENKLAA